MLWFEDGEYAAYWRDGNARGTAVVGIFHDDEVRRAVTDHVHEMGLWARLKKGGRSRK